MANGLSPRRSLANGNDLIPADASAFPNPDSKGSWHSSSSLPKPLIIGIYGLPGSGRTTLLNHIQLVADGSVNTHDGLLPTSGMASNRSEVDRAHTEALKVAIAECMKDNRSGIITDHFTIWREGDLKFKLKHSMEDFKLYTHVIYLDVSAEVLAERCRNESMRFLREDSITHLRNWQKEEISQIQALCHDQDTLFARVPFSSGLPHKVDALMKEFHQHSTTQNRKSATTALDHFFKPTQTHFDSFIVFQGDKGLAPEDSADMIWTGASWSGIDFAQSPSSVFTDGRQHTYNEILQAQLRYDEAVDDEKYQALCKDAASSVHMHPEFEALLRKVIGESNIPQAWAAESNSQLVQEWTGREDAYSGQMSGPRVGLVVVTNGFRLVWEKVLEKMHLSDVVKVIGGGRLSDGCVVTEELKQVIVKHLQYTHKAFVFAVGANPSDLPMLEQADRALVTGSPLDHILTEAITDKGLKVEQLLLSANTETLVQANAGDNAPSTTIPLVDITTDKFKDDVLASVSPLRGLRVHHATDKPSSKLLMTAVLTDEPVASALCKAHRRVGEHLATELLSEHIGLETYTMPHAPLGKNVGHRFCEEHKTLIIAVMSCGLFVAEGVRKVLPAAMFNYATLPEDLTFKDVADLSTIVLVDAVITADSSIVAFIQHIRRMNKKVRIVVLASVVQEQCIADGGLLKNAAARDSIGVVALKLVNELDAVGPNGLELECKMFGGEVASLSDGDGSG